MLSLFLSYYYYTADVRSVTSQGTQTDVEMEIEPAIGRVESVEGEISSIERMRQQSKEVTERLMATFHNIGSSTLNPITISNSPPLPSSSANPPASTSSPISSRTRSRNFPPSNPPFRRIISEQEAARLRPNCRHLSKNLIAVLENECVYQCGLCQTVIKEPH